MLVFLFLTLSLALCQSEPLGKLVDDPASGGQVEWVDQDQVGDSTRWSEKEERQFPLFKPCKTYGTKCQSLGGVCYPRNQPRACDYIQTGNKLCHNLACHCCINCNKACNESQCLEEGGTCRKACKCEPNEYTDVFNPCPASGCACCRKCDRSRSCYPGFCTRDPEHYLNQAAYFVDDSKRCVQRECSCIQKCNGKLCASVGGTCIRNNAQCKSGTLYQSCGCDNKSCGCCIPKGEKGEPAPPLSCKSESST